MKYALLVLTLIGCGHDDPASSDAMDGDGPAVAVDGAMASWRLLHAEQRTASKTITINPTAPGSLLVVGVETVASPQITSVTDNSGNPYQAIVDARSVLGSRAIELWFTPNVPEGATLVTVDTTTVDAIVVWEVAGIDPNAPLDSGAKLDDQPSADLVTSPVLATTKANELVVAVVRGEQTIGNLTSALFTIDSTIGGASWAHNAIAISQPSNQQAEWSQTPAGTFCASSAAFFSAP